MSHKSMLEVSFQLVSKKKRPTEFNKLWKEVQEIMGIDKDDNKTKARFYTQLILDGRFVNLGDNVWDLRARQTYDKVHIDMNDAYTDEEEEEEIEELLDDEKDPVAISLEEDKDFSDDDFEDSDDDYGN